MQAYQHVIENLSVQEIESVSKIINERIHKVNKLYEMTNRLSAIPELNHLFKIDSDNYGRDGHYIGENSNHLQRCVLHTKDYPELNEYIDLYLTLHKNIINFQNDIGCTALMIASMYSTIYSSMQTVQILLKHGADLNLIDNIGWTALMHTCCNLDYESNNRTLMLLLDYHPDTNVQSLNGISALDLLYQNYKQGLTSAELIGRLLNQNSDMTLIESDRRLMRQLIDLNYIEYQDMDIGDFIPNVQPGRCSFCDTLARVIKCEEEHSICIECFNLMDIPRCTFCSN